MIASFVRQFIKSLGVQVVLNNEVVKGPLSYQIIDFISREGKFISYFFIYNETEFFTFSENNANWIGTKQNDLQDRLWKGVRQFDNKEEWIKGKYTKPFADFTVKRITEGMTSVVDFGIEYEGFSVYSVTMFLTSVVGVNLIIAFEGVPIEQLHLFKGCKTKVTNSQIFEYMIQLGLSDFVILEEDTL